MPRDKCGCVYCKSQDAADPSQPRGSSCRISPLEGDGFEPSVPRREGQDKRR